MTAKCKDCRKVTVRKLLKYRVRIEPPYFKVWKRPVFINDKGKQWNGLECPDCKYSL